MLSYLFHYYYINDIKTLYYTTVLSIYTYVVVVYSDSTWKNYERMWYVRYDGVVFVSNTKL